MFFLYILICIHTHTHIYIYTHTYIHIHRASLVAQRLKRLPALRETWVWSLGQEDPLEKEMTTHSSILAWRITWTEEPGGLQSTGSQRVGHDWRTSLPLSYIHTHIYIASYEDSHILNVSFTNIPECPKLIYNLPKFTWTITVGFQIEDRFS